MSPGTYRVGDKMRTVTADDLAEYMAGTVAALDAGLSIPVLSRHAKMGSDEGGPQFSRDDSSAVDGVGWLIDMKQETDGSLVHTIDVTDPEHLKSIDNGSIRFTSPEFCENYTDGKGRKFGGMIRHTAFTPTPRNPDQGEFTPEAAAQFSQFSMDDFVGEGQQFDHILSDDPPEVKAASQTIARALLESLGIFFPPESDLDLSEAEMDKLVATAEVIESAKKKARAAQQAAEKESPIDSPSAFAEDDSKKKPFPPEEKQGVSDNPVPDSQSSDIPADQVANTEDPPANPDLPTDPKIGQNATAVIAQLSALNIELPADLEFPEGPYLDVVLAALKTATKMKAEAEVEEKPKDQTVIEEPNTAGQFDEFDESTMDPLQKALVEEVRSLRKGAEKSAQFSEDQQNDMNRARLVAKVRTAKIPPGMRNEILAMASSVQFSEGDEVSTLSLGDVVDLVEKYIPEGMQFDADKTTTESHPEGEEFFSGDNNDLPDEEVKSRVDEQLKQYGHRKTSLNLTQV